MGQIQVIATSYMFEKNEEYKELVKRYIELGINQIRINCTRFSYKKYIRHINILRECYYSMNKKVDISVDIPYPGIKNRVFFDGLCDEINFCDGDIFYLTNRKENMNICEKILYVDNHDFTTNTHENETIIYGDGFTSFKVLEIANNMLKIQAIGDGILKYGKAVYSNVLFKRNGNISEIVEFLTISRPENVIFSFVESRSDFDILSNEIKNKVNLVPKIETPRAVYNLANICSIDGIKQIVIGRGDLGITSNNYCFAKLQNEIIQYCRTKKIDIIAATDLVNTISSAMILDRSNLTDIYYLLSNGVNSFIASAYISKNINYLTRFIELLENFEH